MTQRTLHIVLCNGASPPPDYKEEHEVFSLDYGTSSDRDRNLSLSLPDFIRSVGHISDRLLDLIEIAVYVHAGDRRVGRGSSNAVEFHGWRRRFLYRIRVRDHEFWSSEQVKEALIGAVEFMTGDASYEFEFDPGHNTAPTSLFDKKEFRVTAGEDASVSLFSGGLDSLVGALEILENNSGKVYLVSHVSQSGIKRTQNQLIEALREKWPSRIRHYQFSSHLHRIKAREETQRSRSLLFGSIAFAIAHTIGLQSINMFENGVTSINFPKRQSLMNGRASRTTHPKTVVLLETLFSLIQGGETCIRNPFLYKTKTDVVTRLEELGHRELYPSAVSCGVARSISAPATHCGGCNQCLDRRFAAYAAEIDEYDNGTQYEEDFITKGLTADDKKKSLLDFLRQAQRFANFNPGEFGESHINEITELCGYLPELPQRDDLAAVETIHELCKRHGKQVWKAYKRMQVAHDDPTLPTPRGSVFAMVGRDDHFTEPFESAPLIERLKSIVPGNEQSKDYETLMEEVIPDLFAPDLVAPRPQVANSTRKGITDLTLRIATSSGFWGDVKMKYGNLMVSFELKNKEKLENSDFDQIASRLNLRKGQFGVLVGRESRDFDEEAIRNWLNDGKVVLAIDDKDINAMLRCKEEGNSTNEYMAEKLRTVLERLG